MTRLLLGLAALLFAAPALSQTSILPAQPRAGEQVTIQFDLPQDRFACAKLGPNGVRMTPGTNDIVVEVQPASCGFVVRIPRTRFALGRLPAGNYNVLVREFAPDVSPPPPPFVTTSFQVVPGTPIPLAEDFAGHWTTDNPGEGVVMTQSQDRLFIVWVTYDGVGNQVWYYSPDARYDETGVAGDLPPRIIGTLYSTRGFPPAGATPPPNATGGTVTPAGFIDFGLPTPAFDRIVLNFRPANGGSIRSIPLSRFRF